MDNQPVKKTVAKPVTKSTAGKGTKRKVLAKKNTVKKSSPKKAAVSTPSSSTPTNKETRNKFGKLLTPKNLEESLGTIVSLRTFCKNCLRYVQQADNLLDTLFVMGNSLQDSGVLKKLSEFKGKNLNTGDFTNILMALINTPVGAGLFKRLSGGDTTAEAAPAQTPEQSPAQTVSAVQPAAQPPRLPPGPYAM